MLLHPAAPPTCYAYTPPHALPGWGKVSTAHPGAVPVAAALCLPLSLLLLPVGLHLRRCPRIGRRSPGVVLDVARLAALNVRGAFPDALLDVLRREAPGFRHVRGNHPVQPGEVGFLAVPLHQALRLPLVLLHRVVLRAIAARLGRFQRL